MQRGERLRKTVPVEHAEGIRGFLLDVIGVWAFTMRNAFGQAVEVEANIIDGCTDEFLIGVDFIKSHKANMDFARNERLRSRVQKWGKVLVPAIEVQGGQVKLPAKKKLGTWVPIDDDMKVLEFNGELKYDKLDEWLRNGGGRHSMGDCPPVTALDVHHHIDTGDAAPIMMKRRRQAQTEDAVVEESVSKMLRANVIEEGNGAWVFPAVLVRKKDGK
ncbi:hypothetical protein L914_07356, partial [Phytophthora nicotianae]